MWVFSSAVHVFFLLCWSLFAVTCQRTDALLRWENAKYSEGNKEIIRNKSLSQAAGQHDSIPQASRSERREGNIYT